METFSDTSDFESSQINPEALENWRMLSEKLDECQKIAQGVNNAIIQIDAAYDLVVYPSYPIQYENAGKKGGDNELKTTSSEFRLLRGAYITPRELEQDLAFVGVVEGPDYTGQRIFYFRPSDHEIGAESIRRSVIERKNPNKHGIKMEFFSNYLELVIY